MLLNLVMVLRTAVKTRAYGGRKRSVATHEFCSYEHQAECEFTYCTVFTGGDIVLFYRYHVAHLHVATPPRQPLCRWGVVVHSGSCELLLCLLHFGGHL